MPASLMVPASLLAVLGKLRVFTAPGFTTFTAMVTGLVTQTGAGTVTGMLTGAVLAQAWPHGRAHAFFSRARWNVDILGIVLAHLIVRTLLPQGAAIMVAVDGTLFKQSGKKVFGAAWQHDGAARGPAASLECTPPSHCRPCLPPTLALVAPLGPWQRRKASTCALRKTS